MGMAGAKISDKVPCPRAQDIDRHVGARLRERRIMLGLTQQQMAELIGVTYHQAHKCEKGINRIAAGRLSSIAQALGVEVGYFYHDMTGKAEAVEAAPQQRLLLELARSFVALPSRKHQEAICYLVHSMAHPDQIDDLDHAMLLEDEGAVPA
jgi:transcriptional regulator with XRE-family HTH domain